MKFAKLMSWQNYNYLAIRIGKDIKIDADRLGTRESLLLSIRVRYFDSTERMAPVPCDPVENNTRVPPHVEH